MNRILVLEGYTNPFGDSHRSHTQRYSPGGSNMRKQQSKMKKCAMQYRRSGKRGSYVAHMKRCLKKGR